MTSDATILIADISGFTDFVSSTELEHSAHIVNELLELMIDANEIGLTLSEIEGDAVLFYKTGDAVPPETIVEQCLAMFKKFHERLGVIGRDAICDCGACQGTSSLGLKFIVHQGTILEIQVAGITKASGLDMIIAHRLLKNEVPAREYLLTTEGYISDPDTKKTHGLTWTPSTQRYPDVGDVATHYALLDKIREGIPPPPARPSAVIPVGDDTLRMEIAAPLVDVYARLIDIEGKRDWVVGLDGLDRSQEVTPRVNETHTCYFQGMRVDFRLLDAEYTSDRAVYLEEADFVGTPFKHQQVYTLESVDGHATSLTFEVKWQEDPPPPQEMKRMYFGGVGASLEVLKKQMEGAGNEENDE